MKPAVQRCSKRSFGLMQEVMVFLVALLLISCGGGGGSDGLPQTLSISASSLSPSAITVNWSADPTPGVIGYDLYRNGVAVEATHIAGTSYTDSGLTADTRYCYKVYAIVFPQGAVSTSNTACATTGTYSTSGWTFYDAPTGYAPDFRISPTGVKHIAYLQSQGNGLHYGLSTGGAWTNTLVDASGGTPSLAVTSFDVAHIAYGNTSAGGAYHASNATGGWATEAVNATGGGLSALAIDHSGKLHMVFTDYNATFSTYEVWYATNASGAWVKSYIMGYNGSIQSVDIAAGSTGTIHVAYAITGAPYCGLEHWSNSGGGWSMTAVDSDMACKVTLELDSSDVPHVAYRKSMQIIHAKLNAGTWNKEVVDTLSWLGGDRVGLGIDTSNYLHLSYGDEYGDLKYATNRSGMWVRTYLDTVTSANVLRMGSDDHAYILYSPDNTGTLRLARSP
jgi:hypothetical protein